MARHPRNYLRTQRLKHALTLQEVADLVGVCKDAISKYELEKRPISAKLIIAGEIIFGMRAAELFPAFYQSVQDDIGRRAAKLAIRLEGRADKASEKKRKLMEGVPERTTAFDL